MSNEIEFHKARVMFAILEGVLVYSIGDKRGHSEWLEEDYNIDSYTFKTITRGYTLHNNIVFYKGDKFSYDEDVISHAYRFCSDVMSVSELDIADLYVGVVVGEVGTIWELDKYLCNVSRLM